MPAKYLVSVGVAFAIFGLIVVFIKEKNFGFSISSIGIAFISIGMGFHAYQLSKKSDERLSILERMNFYRIRGLLVERRLTLREKLKTIENSLKSENSNEKKVLIEWYIQEYTIFYHYSIWVCLTYLQQLDELKDRLTSKQQNKVIHAVDNLFKDLFEGLVFIKSNINPKFIITGNYPGQIEEMYSIVSSFEVFQENTERVKRIIGFERVLTNKIPLILQVKITQGKEEKKEEKNKGKEKGNKNKKEKKPNKK